MNIVVGSRESKLAVAQAQIVIANINKHYPQISTTLVTMQTTGDIILDRPLDKIGGKGLFVKELDRALLDEKVDITVHSFKDMPMQTDDRLPIVAVSNREDPHDCLVLPKGQAQIDFAKPIGCSSARRCLQLKMLYPECTVAPIRGNVLTRLEKLDSGQFSAITLAVAGLKRLGLAQRISRVFEVGEMLPAACQGILAVQARAGFDTGFLANFNHKETWDIAMAERSFVRELDGGCSSPVAAYAQITGDLLTITGLYVDSAGVSYIKTAQGSRVDGEQIGRELALKMRQGSAEYAI